ncbi:MAG: hypothetical protein COB17_04605 [Sulfurimonas sp.]|nr:MAG: hypothetical protein COB17_04605 [Sulfurimonas sp.]
MRFNKQIAVILILSSLLISAIGAAIFLYYENEKTKKENDKQVTVYIAKKDIKADSLIQDSDIVKTVLAKRYLLTKPLLKKEIINKYVKSTIYKNEMFRKEKLSSQISKLDTNILAFKYNSYNLSFKKFENPNYALEKGDILNIISVYPKSKDKANMNYNVKYVVKKIKVLGFLEKGKVVEKAFRKIKKRIKSKKQKNKKVKYELVKVFANELVLDIPDKVILAIIKDYNKGQQLWMIKTNKVILSEKKIISKASKKLRKKAYPYKMYIPKNFTKTMTATIEYGDALIPDVSQEAVITTNLQQECINKNKVLLGLSREVILRSIPSLAGRIRKIVYKNYILAYKRRVNESWYETCDSKYVHKNEVREIEFKRAQGLLYVSKKVKK